MSTAEPQHELLRRLIGQKKLTASDFERGGISASLLHDLLAGRVDFSSRNTDRIARITGTSIELWKRTRDTWLKHQQRAARDGLLKYMVDRRITAETLIAKARGKEFATWFRGYMRGELTLADATFADLNALSEVTKTKLGFWIHLLGHQPDAAIARTRDNKVNEDV